MANAQARAGSLRLSPSPKPRRQFQAGVTDAKGDGFLLKEKHRRRARGGPLSSRRSPGLRATRGRRRRSRDEGGWGRSGKAGVGVGRGGSSGRPGSCFRNWSIRRSVSVQWGGLERSGGWPPDPRPSPAPRPGSTQVVPTVRSSSSANDLFPHLPVKTQAFFNTKLLPYPLPRPS